MCNCSGNCTTSNCSSDEYDDDFRPKPPAAPTKAKTGKPAEKLYETFGNSLNDRIEPFVPRMVGKDTFEYAPGKRVVHVHSPLLCASRDCVVHNPSDHSMRDFPLLWRQDRIMFERTCPHGIGHPDPDHMSWYERKYGAKSAHYEGVHGCDGCCAKKKV